MEAREVVVTGLVEDRHDVIEHARAVAAGSSAVTEKPFTLGGLRAAALRAGAPTPSANRASDPENLRLPGRRPRASLNRPGRACPGE